MICSLFAVASAQLFIHCYNSYNIVKRLQSENMPSKRGNYSDRVLSLRTSNALEGQGYSLFARNETKGTQIMGEYLENYFLESKVLTSGGMAENTVIQGRSDSDIMGVIRDLAVIEDEDQLNVMGNVPSIFAVRTGCSPGYCKLQFTSEQHKLFKISRTSLRHYFGITNSVKDMCISSTLFRENNIPGELLRGENFEDVVYENNGPAITNRGVDYVYSFQMQTWPEEAKKWASRLRKNDWPHKTVLTRLLRDSPCYVTPVGHKLSTEFDLEWRFSFVGIERVLIWSMNETQFKCYVFLKMLKAYYFGKYHIFDDITTYHVKTIMFWLCEDYPENVWVPRKLILCVKKCLNKLEMCMKEKKLDHFIIPENNLFGYKQFVYKDIEPAFSELHKDIYDLTAQLILHGHRVEDFDAVSSDVIAYDNKCKLISVYCSSYYDPGFPDSFRKAFPEAELLMPCVQIVQALAKRREELWKWAERENKLLFNKDSLSELVVQMIKEGKEMDFSSSCINTAMVYFMHGNYQKVITELNFILSDKSLKRYPSSLGDQRNLCLCSGKMYLPKKEDKSCHIKDIKNDRNKLVADFCTEDADKYTLPYPLALQLYLNSSKDIFRYNPIVLSYYLLCISQLKQGLFQDLKIAMRRFKKAVRYNKGRKDYYLSLVLYGHCLYWTGDTEGAYHCFVKSIQEKRSVRNVAVYLMAFLISDWCKNNFF